MSRKLTASDRKALIRLASTMEKGSEERKAILAGLSKSADLASERMASTSERILDQLGYDPYDIDLQELDESMSGSMEYAGGLIKGHAKKSIPDRLWAIQYGLDLLAGSLSSYGGGVHRAGGDWSDWRKASDALKKARTAVDKLHYSVK